MHKQVSVVPGTASSCPNFVHTPDWGDRLWHKL